MNTESLAYRQLLVYIDGLNAGISQLSLAIEEQMKGHGYVPIEKAGDQGYWFLSPNIGRPHGWRMKMVTRLLVPAGAKTADHSLLYQVVMESESAFDFPTILGARVEHPKMSGGQIYSKVWTSAMIATLHREASSWTGFAEENGWCVAVPAYKTAITRLKGYILNLLDVDSPQAVSEKIVEPLVHSGDLGWSPPESHLSFPGLNVR